MNIQGPTIFIVDDDRASRESVRALVSPMGIATSDFASGEDFLKHYAPEMSGCLVTDLRMHGMSGLELQQHVVSQEWLLPAIILTGCADVPATVEMMQLGAVTVLEKPCRDMVLWDAIRKALAFEQEQRVIRRNEHEIRARVKSLSQQERQILEMIIAGLPNKAIAIKLDISLRTVEGRRKEVFGKMNAKSVAELVTLVKDAERPLCYCGLNRNIGR
jgi:FixJ family two-component response regulator